VRFHNTEVPIQRDPDELNQMRGKGEDLPKLYKFNLCEASRTLIRPTPYDVLMPFSLKWVSI
jgi:hypothetical protein